MSRELLKRALMALSSPQDCGYFGALIEEIEAELAKPELIEEFQIGISYSADFGNNRWVFEMPEGFKVGAGQYKIIRVKS
ncbi:MAG: hypothetical protein ACXW1Z_19905 [Methylobacter sp.]